MEEKKMRELGMEEMDRVSGGGGTDRLDNVEYWVKDHPCPQCGENDANSFYLMNHAIFYAQILCIKCGERFFVYKERQELNI